MKRAPDKILNIKLADLFRATLSDDCGNDGYIGISPDGSEYHVVVPVDRQLARGLVAHIAPDDGTPFGGYKGWHYFCCLSYSKDSEPAQDERKIRLRRAEENGWLIQKWARSFGIEVNLVDDLT